MTTPVRSKALCPGSGLTVTYVFGTVEPHCQICGKSLGRQGRKGNKTMWSPHLTAHIANRHLTDVKGNRPQ